MAAPVLQPDPRYPMRPCDHSRWTLAPRVLLLAMLALPLLSACDDDEEGSSAAPAQVLYADNVVRTIDLKSPETALAEQTITGLDPGETLVAIDRRPANDDLHGVTSDGRVVRIDLANATATPTATLAVKFQGTRFALSFNPLTDRIRIASDVGQNLRVNAETGATIVDAVLAYATGDAHEGTTPRIGAATHVQQEDGNTTSVTLFALDLATHSLVVVSPPNAGTLSSIGPVGVQATAAAMDASRFGVIYVVLFESGATRLYTVDGGTGELTPLGIVGDGSGVPLGFSVA